MVWDVDSLTHSVSQSFTPTLPPSLTYTLTHSLSHSHTHTPIQSCVAMPMRRPTSNKERHLKTSCRGRDTNSESFMLPSVMRLLRSAAQLRVFAFLEAVRLCGIPCSQTNSAAIRTRTSHPTAPSSTRILASCFYFRLPYNTASRLVDSVLYSRSICIYPMKDRSYPFVWVSKRGDFETDHCLST